jgi:EAL domain-containing protein (putative c-di-GMP-specific phosphodiesterase class I)
LLRAAELALHQARNASEGIAFYSADADATIRRRLTLDEDLRHAIERGELRVVYQPQVEFDSGRITVAEALLRWEHPLFGAVSPQEFVPIAEEAGLITRIGEWVLKTACEQNKAWQDAGLPPLVIAVNLSPRQFAQKDLCKVVSRVLKETGLAPQCLELEITESLAMENAAHTADVLQELHKIGVTVSLDDFGTGFSSLSYLGRLPLDVLKIDRSFVRELTQNPQIEAVTRGTVALAKSLRLDVVVEGVETLEQFVLLRNIGFARLQGFFFSQPVGAEPFADLLRADVLSWSKDWALG